MSFSDSSVTQVDRLGPRIDVDLTVHALHAAEERSLCVTVDGGLPGSGLEPPYSPDSDRFILACKFGGPVIGVEPDGVTLRADGSFRTLRLLMPPGLDLEPLRGHHIEVSHRLEIDPMRSMTIDLSIRNRYGDLLLWARDGVLPHPLHSHGHNVRVSVERDQRFLAVRTSGAPAIVPAAASSVVNTGLGRYVVLCARVHESDAAFVFVRKYF
ncbi:MAG: hypothetical protein R3A78_14690 [Polyangiales bacterium]